MPLGEFELIARYFGSLGVARDDVALGVGDDAALLVPPPGTELVAATDALVEGVHFPHDSPADSVGHRALAVNLSDLAAMGAEPRWALLSLTLPESDPQWLEEFARGLGELAREHGVALVGGDTTRGPLCVSVHALGVVPVGAAMRRAAGRPGDVLCVTGAPGDAAGGLCIEVEKIAADERDASRLLDRFRYPQPRCALGMRLREFARACIDVSDGLAADAGKLAAASGCAATIDVRTLPLSEPLVRVFGIERARQLALTGGEDCELLFTVPGNRFAELERVVPPSSAGWRRIGALGAGEGVSLESASGVTQFSGGGYDHFADG